MITHHNQIYLCRFTMDLLQVIALLKQQPCATIQEENHRIMKHDENIGDADILALQTTINDHRTMINYLINNLINATFVTDAIADYYSRMGPILTCWRDLVDLLCITLLIGFIIYLLLCRIGCNASDKVLSFLLKSIITSIQYQQPPTTLEPSLRKKQPPG